MYHLPISMLGLVISAFSAFISSVNGVNGYTALSLHCPEAYSEHSVICYVANPDGSVYQSTPSETTDGRMIIELIQCVTGTEPGYGFPKHGMRNDYQGYWYPICIESVNNTQITSTAQDIYRPYSAYEESFY